MKWRQKLLYPSMELYKERCLQKMSANIVEKVRKRPIFKKRKEIASEKRQIYNNFY